MNKRPADSEIQGWFSPLIRPRLLERRLAKGSMCHSEIGLLKRCSRCGEDWPFDTEFFFGCSHKPDGLFDWCRACYQVWRWPNGRPSEAKGQHAGAAP